MNFKDFFSPNFDKAKRSRKTISYIILHYTGMQSERESLNRLCDFKSKVSCHYLINRNGNIFRLVKDKNIAWHAGESYWSKYKKLNKNSIGIELTNRGHKFGYQNYTSKQIDRLIDLCGFLIKKYRISRKNIMGHSDISPDRKIDPGEKFPWELLSKKEIGIWHNLNKNLLKKLRKKIIKQEQYKIKFIQDLENIGYRLSSRSNKRAFTNVMRAFQRHFRKELINGILDLECAAIASNLAEKY